MRIPLAIGRILALLALAFSASALCDSGMAMRNYVHVPGGSHRQFPSHRIHRSSSRGRRSQGWEAPEMSGTDHAHAQPQYAAGPAKPASQTGSAGAFILHPVALVPQRTLEHRRFITVAPVRCRRNSQAARLVRGPPLA